MRNKLFAPLLLALQTIFGTLLCNNLCSQSNDTTQIVNFPLSHEDFSLYDFASIRFETDKTEKPPADLIKKKFQPVKEIFQKDDLHFVDSVQSVWFRFAVRNHYLSDTTVVMVFPGSVSKGVLYQQEGEKITLVGKTGWVIAVSARTIPREWGRIDMLLRANSVTNYYLQIPRTGLIVCPKTPALESIATADVNAYNLIEKGRRPQLLWLHFFAGIFFMFFVFGFIKYLMLGKDKAYLYYSLLGLFSAFVTLAHSEYPPLELPWFENVRGIELIDLMIYSTFIIHGLFAIEIIQLQIKYPRITRAIKWYFVVKFLLAAIDTKIQAVDHKGSIFPLLVACDAFFFIFLMLAWVEYLATIRKGFYRYIFLGAITIFIAYTFVFAIRFFSLQHFLPPWFGEDGRGNAQRIMQIALVIDMCFYFAGLAYRDRQVEKDKINFQEQLIEQLETNKQFQEKFTAELEQQVTDRTAEVVEEKAVVERQKDVIQKEKEKSDDLLLNILPAEVADELKEKGYTTAKSFEEVTVLFSDIKGFTNVAEKMTAQELVKEINTYFSAFDRITQQYGLEKIKTIGDAYISAGGLPEKNSATVKNVVEAALAMQLIVEKLKQERLSLGRPYFELRIGIHTGPVVAGVVGIKKFQYDIWGDTVNLAARMEQSGVPGKINISHHTYEAIKKQFKCVHRGKIDAKNKGEIDMYFVE